MKKLALSLVLLLFPFASEAKPTKGWYTMDAMGCMIVRECRDNVDKVSSIKDLERDYPNTDYSLVSGEFDSMIASLQRVNVNVFLADEKYFPPGHRGVYHTVGNNFFLNRRFMHRPSVLMTVMRHEGWHAAQDCMAGTIKNSLIALIHPEEMVPPIWRDIVEKTYPKSAVPFEAEAKWAGKTANMTADALNACAAGEMWKVYKPTPLTEKWLREEGYIDN
jgi:hypothetical protein